LACQHPNLSFQWICLAAEQRWRMVFALKDRLLDAAIQAAEQRARETRKVADEAACEAWNIRMSNGGPAKPPSPSLGDAINAGYRYMEIECGGCEMHSIVDLTATRRRKETPVWQLDGRLRCGRCTVERGYSFDRGRLVRLRRSGATMITDGDLAL
jgi:hypothetical protein